MKNVKLKLIKVKKADDLIYNKILDGIRKLQTSAVDKESFFALYNLLERKWKHGYEFNNLTMKAMVSEFFDYFSKIWVNSQENNWYQASNPQHITTNNNVEGTNQAFKKEYTGRIKISFPNMFAKLTDLLKNWGRTNTEEKVDPEKIPVSIVKLLRISWRSATRRKTFS